MLHWTIPLKNNKSNKEESRKESAKHTVLSLKVSIFIYINNKGFSFNKNAHY